MGDEDQKTCRICLQDGGAGLISPCSCSGTQRWVHRHCLDRWRSTQQDRAFSKCTECNYEYQMVAKSHSLGAKRWRNTKIKLLIARDTCFVFLAFNLCIFLVGLAVRAMDRNAVLLQFFSQGCLINMRWSGTGPFWCQHTLTVYYLWGFLICLVVLGFFGMCLFCAHGCRFTSAEQATCEICCNCPYICVSSSDCSDCCCCCPRSAAPTGQCCCPDCCEGGCNCEGLSCPRSCAGASEEAVAVFLFLAIAVIVVLAILGFLLGIILAVLACQKIAQRHLSTRVRMELCREFIVKDLSASTENDYPIDLAERESPHDHSEGNENAGKPAPLALQMDTANQPPTMAPTLQRSGLSQDNASQLQRLGLLLSV